MNINLFHKLEGGNIRFKALELKDIQAIHNYASDENVSRFIGWRLMKTLDETHTHIEEMLQREAAGSHLYASVVLKLSQEVIGTVMIFNFDHEANHAEIGYVFHSSHWGRGYGTEALSLMAEFAFGSLNLHKLHAQVVEANVGSLRILEKNGFKREGRLKDYYFIDGSYYDKILLGKLQLTGSAFDAG
ncbi:GNAT family protein [Desulfosporosinus sp. PR]|uniref:GNAT family N-acetyltransferase n=1 Tax=Candidatus Desulfosporosinus nitrosoreducens TaxID=3401928 RepID=UPI0027F5C600|nr:GNAT family protein [Desulfosporosinus sp. PR]MDQ7092629.1 GNAT family protein [Desulfosporosinus sp. PR]